MKSPLLLILTLLCCFTIQAQEKSTEMVTGKVLNSSTGKVLSDVNIINLTQLSGTITDEEGHFVISAAVNDTLYFSYLGFKSIRVRVTEDWKKYGNVKIKMTESAFALESVVLEPIQLTGYLEIDAKNIPIYNNFRYQISNLNLGYEAGAYQPGGFSKTLSSIFNPVDYLHIIFTKNKRQLDKLRKMRNSDQIQRLLEQKFDRQTLAVLLQVSPKDINKILSHCSYSKTFIKTANDYQVLEAISDCYEHYKALN